MPKPPKDESRETMIPEYSLNRLEKSSLSINTHASVPEHNASILDSGLRTVLSHADGLFDPNIDPDPFILEHDSPYPEVRSAVANSDDPFMPCSTLRAWTLGIIFAIILPGLNQFFYLRYPSVVVSGLVAQLIIFPLGRGWMHFIPRIKILGMSLNPGPFTVKEHVLATIMASVGYQSAYATDIVAVQKIFYHQSYNFVYNWMLVMSTQLIGFSIGGIAWRFLVAPPSMIWPNTLVLCALFNTLHSQKYAYGGDGIRRHEGLSRERFFFWAFVGSVIWFLVPGYLFQALSMFTWVCWLAPNNVKINQIFGYKSGLGFSLISFDWNVIAYIGSPLATPWWAEANVLIGFLFFYWFLVPVLYYSNAWNSHYLPISSLDAFDNRGKPFNVSRILNNDSRLDLDSYKSYSPLFLSTTFVMSYGLSFLTITATITHAILHFWKPIKIHFKRSLKEQPDIHAQLMSQYKQVPQWWYMCIFAVTFTFACVCIMAWPTEMTIWALIIALAISIVYVVPIGMIQAITNRQIGLNVISELIVGFMLPGRPIALMMFKTFGYMTMAQGSPIHFVLAGVGSLNEAMQFTADFKLGHYMKVPPRPMFFCQVVATVIAGTVQLGVQSWMFTNIPDLCSQNQKDGFICAGTQVFGTASIVWGVIGPGLQFSKSGVYYALTFFFIVGAGCPVVLWCFTRRYPESILNYLNFPLLFAGVSNIPPATAVNYVPWGIIGFVFQYLVRRRHFSFWAKYNYVLSAALDAGTAVGIILIYFCLQYPRNGTIGRNTVQKWWGNQVFQHTADWSNKPLKSLPDGETFGPTSW